MSVISWLCSVLGNGRHFKKHTCNLFDALGNGHRLKKLTGL